jgi:hypothetical protein
LVLKQQNRDGKAAVPVLRSGLEIRCLPDNVGLEAAQLAAAQLASDLERLLFKVC